MRVKSLDELRQTDERTQHFTPLGLGVGRKLTPESAASYHQQTIADVELDEAVPKSVQIAFDRVRLMHSYGILLYDLFTITDDLCWIVMEQALRERFIEFYSAGIPIVQAAKQPALFAANRFDDVAQAFWRGGSHYRKGWQLQLPSGDTMGLPLTLEPLLRWAREAKLLDGQHNRRLQLWVYPKLRNHFAHGAHADRTGIPPDSARSIHDLAEIINRLWGVWTPGGRLYQMPQERTPVVIGWSPDATEKSILWPEQLRTDTRQDWSYLIVLAVGRPDDLWEFDARYEVTRWPAELLWGPGTRADGIAWLDSTQPQGDQVQYLDRLFAVKVDGAKVYLPQRPEILLGLPAEDRRCHWRLIRADYPPDAWGHMRHQAAGQDCPNPDFGGCAIEEVADGDWQKIADMVRRIIPGVAPALYSTTAVPRSTPLPGHVTYP